MLGGYNRLKLSEEFGYQPGMIKTRTVCNWVFFIFVSLICSVTIIANPTLPSLFSDHVVLQRGREIPVWGWADAGEKIVVTLGTDARKTIVGPDGRWRVRLPPRDAGGPFRLVIVGKSTVVVRDVMIGEVWVASGQSNMDFTLARAQNAAEVLPKANSPPALSIATEARISSPSPLGSPTVFNFFLPGYQSPGEISDSNLLVSPELQIFNESTVAAMANDLTARICQVLGEGTPRPYDFWACAKSFLPKRDCWHLEGTSMALRASSSG